ncbi:hypothetical protein PAXRUDRAFT_13600 [Paxillus rubicundulus Ve08.2h10]|uniref:Unplaced genomic scaffold scaffold_526, whole genome shotgun sequence n=1 Tax=Paxillus rubicundulus Ve08.2h10 TaxID=930991 RepID=A0A0D0DKQ1_9AGAM|nr:hypothetical protein PAXRUDRAFT_13600 [Paxillus rubicundulus Ve08.2h10]
MVVKIYWGEEVCISEQEILKEVWSVVAEDEVVEGHVLILLLKKRFSVSMSTIREALGLKDPHKGSHTLFLLIFKKLSPIQELKDTKLLNAWGQCHYCLWKAGIHHHDVSCRDLMYYRVNDKVVGMLNGYDLASLASRHNPLGNKQTGTMLFMAINLLATDSQDGEVEHLYHHDMESFI